MTKKPKKFDPATDYPEAWGSVTPAIDWDWIVEKRVRLQPVVAIDGKTVDWWSAGFTKVARDGRNMVVTCSDASTPQEALAKLKAGDYTYKNGMPVKARKR